MSGQRKTGHWPVAAATHAARETIGVAPAGETLWPGMRDFIACAKASGFDGIDLSDSVIPFDHPRPGGLKTLATAASDAGLRFAALNLLRCSLADPDYGAKNAERVRYAIGAAAALQAGIVSISLALPRAVDDCNLYRGLDHSRGASRTATDGDFERTADHLHALTGPARAAGVALSIEMHHASIADNAAATARLHRMVGAPDVVGVNPDLINSYWAYAKPEEDWREQFALLAPLTNIWHVKNVRRIEKAPGRAEYLGTSLTDGDIDYAFACATMRDAGFEGWVSIERGGSGDALATMRESLEQLRDLMSNLKVGNQNHALQG